MQEVADEVVRAWGGIDVWVNDAMVSVFAPAWEITPAEYKRVTEVNFLGTVHGTLAREGAFTPDRVAEAIHAAATQPEDDWHTEVPYTG